MKLGPYSENTLLCFCPRQWGLPLAQAGAGRASGSWVVITLDIAAANFPPRLHPCPWPLDFGCPTHLSARSFPSLLSPASALGLRTEQTLSLGDNGGLCHLFLLRMGHCLYENPDYPCWWRWWLPLRICSYRPFLEGWGWIGGCTKPRMLSRWTRTGPAWLRCRKHTSLMQNTPNWKDCGLIKSFSPLFLSNSRGAGLLIRNAFSCKTRVLWR